MLCICVSANGEKGDRGQIKHLKRYIHTVNSE